MSYLGFGVFYLPEAILPHCSRHFGTCTGDRCFYNLFGGNNLFCVIRMELDRICRKVILELLLLLTALSDFFGSLKALSKTTCLVHHLHQVYYELESTGLTYIYI